MTSRGKKMFLILSVVVPFMIYCIVYYAPIIRNASYQAKEFVSFEYKWGAGNNLENSYNSATGEYRYLNNHDSLIVKQIKMSPKDFKYLDSVADVQGFWNLPALVANKGTDLKTTKAPRYFMQFNYKRKTKTVTFLQDFNENDKMKSAVGAMQKTIALLLDEQEAKQSK